MAPVLAPTPALGPHAGVGIDDLYGVVVASLIGYVLNYVAAKLVASDVVAGSPRWSWRLGQCYQLIVFPGLVAWCWSTRGWGEDWLSAGWDSFSDMHRERIFLYCMIGYMVKDFGIMDDNTLILHHVATIGAGVSCMGMPEGVGLFVICTATFELGSMAYSFKNLHAHSARIWDAFIVGHSASNAAACAWAVYYLALPGYWDAFRLGLSGFCVLLAGVRQWICLNDYRDNKQAATTSGGGKGGKGKGAGAGARGGAPNGKLH
eukprot:CAMPEP_0203825164 /NCGR_PEP_ID=MMETSP0115-20131106/53595_1 /ASSEMBLY_ACC=CAM_ASM_000227 /TAXON_ID=33651 /ORGANISM="Bicosoecid sp, Strain ms1" /LENGTH=261 /DNA_ID=CAMNT_0050734207 /DNA_START=47 /DNA_END=829 /DNA_ORIENTATION=-